MSEEKQDEVPETPTEVPNKNSSEVPDKETSQNLEESLDQTILHNWSELNEIPIQDYFDKGYKPRVKTNKDGTRYITLRRYWKEEDGWHDSEKSLGPYDPERWALIESMFPKRNISKSIAGIKSSRKESSSLLSVKVAKPLPTTVHLDLATLQWYSWAQSQGYDGSLDQFVNQAIDGYFREYHKLELAVIFQKG